MRCFLSLLAYGGVVEPGECVMTRLDDPVHGSRLRIERADRRVLITPELLDEITADPSAWTVLREPPPLPEGCARFRYQGCVLRVEAENRTVIYRIGDYPPERSCYVAEWPD